MRNNGERAKSGKESGKATLKELGIDKHESSECQKLAEIDSDTFGEIVEAAIREGRISQAEILKRYKQSKRAAKNAAGAHDGTDISNGDSEGDGWKLLLGDFRERLQEVPAGSVNVIVTDPPYPAEFLPLWYDLGEEASRLLCGGGLFAARCGHLFLPQILNALGEHLRYGWIYAEPLPGSNVCCTPFGHRAPCKIQRAKSRDGRDDGCSFGHALRGYCQRRPENRAGHLRPKDFER